MITGTVTSVTDSQVILDLGYDVSSSIARIEVPREECKIGGRIKVYLSRVEMTPKGPKVYISRRETKYTARTLQPK